MDNSVLVPMQYGEIYFCFNEVMEAKGINRNQLARRANIRFEVADRFYRGNIARMDMDVLAKICFVLDCEAGDVIKYRK